MKNGCVLSDRPAVGSDAARDLFHIPDVNWTARSLLAATGAAFCVLLTAISATASVKRAKEARTVELAVADEAELMAEFADFLAERTAEARASLDAPRLKPAKTTAAILEEGPAAKGVIDFDFSLLTVAALKGEERRCLADAIYYEARSESRLGQAAVADVVLNRVASAIYPNSICEVVYQGSERRTGCQFSFTCDGSMKARRNEQKYAEAELMAGAMLAGVRAPVSRYATHYHADYVSPPWAQKLTPTATIGVHKFYRFPSRRVVASAE